MILNDNKYVWAPDGREGFLLGTVNDINTETISVAIHGNEKKVVTAPYKCVFPAEDDINKDYEDNCALMYLNEATLLHNLRLRYKSDKIYTYVANILIAVNPYNEITNLYSKDTIMKYKGKSLGMLPPHVFAIADKTYRDMKVLKQSQSIIVSGESGAGKTESTKYIIRYLTESYGQGISGNIEKRIVETNPLLEAFGNAKTLRNLNSSRFGKYVEVHFDEKATINGAFVSHYLLEKTRICTQNPGERNYHVFYRMCAGSPYEMKSALKLKDASKFNYLNKSSLKEPAINDTKDFKLLDDAMNSVGITVEQKSDIYRIAAVVLHLGNIEFQENSKDRKGGSQLTQSSESIAVDVAKLLGVQPGEIHMCLTTRIMMTTKGGAMGTLYKVPLKPDKAAAGRDAFAKSIYSKLFDYIVSCVNQCFPFKHSETFIGVLDIAGFEFFEVNGFEQFCINYCNEKLQQFFNERILKEEQALYKKEGLGLKDIDYTDNEDCIELFEKKTTGIMDLLDEEMKFPAPSELHFTLEVHQNNKDHFRLAVPRKSPLPIHRSVKEDEGFLIRHFAGAVCYQTSGFLSRNNDALHENLEQLLQESTDPFIRNMFPPPAKFTNNKRNTKKLAFESIGKKFRAQLCLLMGKLGNTGANFIRCIKPNDQLKNHDFEGGQILSQLQCAGMVSVLHLMQEGFPSRTPFINLYDKYKSFLPPNLVRLDPRTFSHALFHAVGMDNNDFKFGLTKVFFRPGKFAEFDQIMRSDPHTLNILIKKVLKWIIRNRWKRAIWCAVSVQKLANKITFRREMLICIQKYVRMFLAVRKHRPRYKGLLKITKLEEQIVELMKLVASLKREKKSSEEKVNEIKCLVDEAKRKITNTIMKQNQIDIIYTDLVKKIHTLLKALHSEKAVQQEQERLEKIQEQMMIEKKKQEKEDRRKKEEEDQRKVRLAHEAKMKEGAKEADLKRKLEEENSKALIVRMSEEQKSIELLKSQQESQKQRDYELALRLAADPSTMISEDRVQLKRNIPTAGTDNKFDHLKKWTYAELRDTINISCDLELLEACRVEFHRRLKVYHTWRKRHMKNKNNNENQRAPVDVIKNGEATFTSTAPASVTLTNPFRKDPVNIQRYFRVPFSKPSDKFRYEEYRKSGWWYAHFDGEWVARQVELHPNGALLLVAGHNDVEICELSLTETRLSERPGAEISADDFNEVWMNYGGDVDKIFRSKVKK